MSVTLTDTRASYPDAIECEQVASMQLFLVHYPDYSLLVSYRTVVGYSADSSIWCLTNEWYSVSTARQMSRFARDEPCTNVSSMAWGKGRLYL